jgi:putative acetyltransferase
MKRNNALILSIQRLRPNDVENVSKLIRTTLKDINIKDYSYDVIHNLFDYYSPANILTMSHNQLICVALLDNRIVGTVSLKDYSILALFVKSNMLKQGIGTLLMKHIESLARKKGYQLVTIESSITASDFYRKLGYQTITSKYSEKYGQVIIMEKLIVHACT